MRVDNDGKVEFTQEDIVCFLFIIFLTVVFGALAV